MAALTNQASAEESATSPPAHVALVTPSDSADLANVTRGVSFAGAGALKVTTYGGETVVIPSGALAVGVIHPLKVSRIHSTSTTATGIVAYW